MRFIKASYLSDEYDDMQILQQFLRVFLRTAD